MQDWQDRETRDEKEALLYYNTHTCSLDSFTDEQLNFELKARAKRNADEIAKKERILKHNEPFKAQIKELENQLCKLNKLLLEEK